MNAAQYSKSNSIRFIFWITVATAAFFIVGCTTHTGTEGVGDFPWEPGYAGYQHRP